MKKDPKKKNLISVKSVAARLMESPKSAPRMGKQ